MEIVIASLWIWSGLIWNADRTNNFHCYTSTLAALITTLVVLL